ncbi:substrate-binding periplasmic protein [Neptunicella sp. SCSIO 80796]|uniref:substrate-binding periplasmic protein n=1 Tax=Neptunicella plasticusilytica TaxID=3117012 RepID=UPI003A4DF8A5
MVNYSLYCLKTWFNVRRKVWIRVFLYSIFLSTYQAYSAPLEVYIADYPPFQVLDEESGHSGFSVELFKEIVKLTDLEVEYIAVPWVRALAKVAKRPNSLLFTMAKTPERDKLYQWVDTIYRVNEGVFALDDRKDISINKLDDVHQYTIALPRGDVSIKTLNIYPDHIQGVSIVEHQAQCIKMLKLGRVDLNYNNDVGFFMAAKMMGLKPDQFKQVFVTGQAELGIAANKTIDIEIVTKIRKALVTLKANGVYNKLQDTWFSSNYL